MWDNFKKGSIWEQFWVIVCFIIVGLATYSIIWGLTSEKYVKGYYLSSPQDDNAIAIVVEVENAPDYTIVLPYTTPQQAIQLLDSLNHSLIYSKEQHYVTRQ